MAGLVAVVVLLAAAAAASAAERPFSLRYGNNVNGQITMAANVMLQCPTDTVDPLMNSGCTGSRAGTSSRNNNSFDMRWLDVDSDPSTFTSSSATLAVPAGSRVLFAGLYWTGLNRKGEAISGANGFKAVPQDPPNVAAIGTVKLRTPGSSAYTGVTAAGADVDTAAIAVGGGYAAFADVTAIVSAAGAGTYTVADLQTGTGGNAFAGWSLVVAYANPDEPLRNLSVFDGLQVVSGSQQIDIPLSGFKTPSTGAVRTTVGVVAAEGDAGLAGDYLTVNENRLTDAVHPSNNTENSTIANRGSYVTTKNPDWRNNLGYDSSLFSADGFLGNGATTAIFRAKTSGDTYAPQAITFATELFSPNVVLTKAVSGGTTPGDTATFTITATNNGLSNATGVQLRDVIPQGLAYVAGPSTTATVVKDDTSGAEELVVNLGTGASATAGGTLAPSGSASFTFTATINDDAALGQVINNTATLQFTSPDLGLPVSVVADADLTVAYPDPGVTKSLVSSSGNQYTFQMLVRNDGTLPTSGTVQVGDTLPAGVTLVGTPSGTGWTSCSGSGSPVVITCSRSGSGADALAAGASYPPVTFTATYPPGTAVENTAALTASSGGQPSGGDSPARLNDSSTATSGTSPLATLRVNKAALTGTINPGVLGGFRIGVRNDGPSPATGATLVDTLDSRFTFKSVTTTQGSCSTAPGASGTTTLSCAFGTLAVGSTATVVVRVLPTAAASGAGPINNTATADSDVTPGTASDSATLTVRPSADLGVTKTTPANVSPGTSVAYTLTATNSSASVAASNVRLVDRLPPGVVAASASFSAVTSGGSCAVSNGVVTCTWASVAALASVSATITVPTTASPTDAEREVVNTVNVYSSTPDLNPGNNEAQVTSYITNVADLQVNATGPGSIAAGATGEVAFITTNNGPSTAVASQLVVDIPADLTPISAPAGCSIAGQTVTCALGDLANGASVTTTIGVRAAPGVVSVSAAATADVSSSTPDYDLRNNGDLAPFVMGPVADLVITKTAGAATVNAGGSVDWTLNIANNGPDSSNGSVVTDTLPAGLTPTSVSSSVPDACSIAGQVVTCRPGEIVPNAGYQALIVTSVDPDYAGAQITNTATLAPGGEADPNAANNTASASVRVNPGATGADLAITKTASAKAVKPGGTLGYTMVVTNTGGSVSTAGTVTDTLPQGLTPTVATINGQACTIRGRTVTCPVGFLPIDSTATVSITATVGKDRAGATLLNTATVTTGAEADPNARNNTARALSRVTVPPGTRARLAIRTRVGPAVARPGGSVLVSATVRTVSRYPANTVRICITIPRGLAYRGSTGTRRGSVVCWVRPQLRQGAPVTVRYRAVARRAGTVGVLGTAIAGNAARVSDPSSLPVLGVTG